jgi:hypothetical protein
MKEYLRACPYCGSHTVEVCRTNPGACWIRCAECGADADSHKTRSGAFRNWNRRLDDGVPADIGSDDDREWRERKRAR